MSELTSFFTNWKITISPISEPLAPIAATSHGEVCWETSPSATMAGRVVKIEVKHMPAIKLVNQVLSNSWPWNIPRNALMLSVFTRKIARTMLHTSIQTSRIIFACIFFIVGSVG